MRRLLNRLTSTRLAGLALAALLGGDGDVVADIFRTRVLNRGKGSEVWGWGTAYGKPTQTAAAAPVAAEVKK